MTRFGMIDFGVSEGPKGRYNRLNANNKFKRRCEYCRRLVIGIGLEVGGKKDSRRGRVVQFTWYTQMSIASKGR